MIGTVLAVPLMLAMAPAGAQPARDAPKLRIVTLTESAPIQSSRRATDYTAQNPPTFGSFRPIRGIIVGTEVSPNATFGIGMFRSMPKWRSSSDQRFEMKQKNSRKLGLGLKVGF